MSVGEVNCEEHAKLKSNLCNCLIACPPTNEIPFLLQELTETLKAQISIQRSEVIPNRQQTI